MRKLFMFFYMVLVGSFQFIAPKNSCADGVLNPYAIHNWNNYPISEVNSALAGGASSIVFNTQNGADGFRALIASRMEELRQTTDWGKKNFTEPFTTENVKWMAETGLFEDLGEIHFTKYDYEVFGLDALKTPRPLPNGRNNYKDERAFGFNVDKLLVSIGKVNQGETSYGNEVLGSLICLNKFVEKTRGASSGGSSYQTDTLRAGGNTFVFNNYNTNTNTNTNTPTATAKAEATSRGGGESQWGNPEDLYQGPCGVDRRYYEDDNYRRWYPHKETCSFEFWMSTGGSQYFEPGYMYHPGGIRNFAHTGNQVAMNQPKKFFHEINKIPDAFNVPSGQPPTKDPSKRPDEVIYGGNINPVNPIVVNPTRVPSGRPPQKIIR